MISPLLPRLAAALMLVTLAACATSKKPHTSGESAAPHKATPSPSPAPAPTPQARYTATVRIEGGESTERDITPDRPTPAPSPANAVAIATPTPKKAGPAAPLVLIGSLWQKVFPPKKSPAAVPVPTTETRPKEGLLGRTWHRFFPRKQASPVAAPPQWIGTIKLVNEREGYALIDASNSPTLGPGETLNAIGNDTESGVLRTTTDRNPPFFIADLVSGKPRAGDRVYSPTPQKNP